MRMCVRPWRAMAHVLIIFLFTIPGLDAGAAKTKALFIASKEPAPMVKPRSDKETPEEQIHCEGIMRVYNTLSLTQHFQPVTNNSTSITSTPEHQCKITETCCSISMEANLQNSASDQLYRSVQDKIIGVRINLEKHTRDFDIYMRQLLNESAKDLNVMFSATYGTFYTQHSALFMQLYDNLTEFYAYGHPFVETTLDQFFSDLFIRMFSLLNPQYTITPDYHQCMATSLTTLKPFAEQPIKMKRELARSLKMARTLTESLTAARDTVRAIMEIRPTNQCASALLSMQYCSQCAGDSTVRPCHPYCLNVLKGCLAGQSDLEQDWNALIDSLLSLIHMMKSGLNIESAIDSIDLKISSAIMTLQEKSEYITTKLIGVCGQPPTVTFWRKRRTTRDLNSLQFRERKDSKLAKLLSNIEPDLSATVNFWLNLPKNLCVESKMSALVEQTKQCWNGHALDSYNQPVVGDGLANQINNPEVPLEPRPNAKLSEQMLKMRYTAEMIKETFDAKNDNIDALKSKPIPSNTGRGSIRKTVNKQPSWMVDGSGAYDSFNQLIDGSGKGPYIDMETGRQLPVVDNQYNPMIDDEDNGEPAWMKNDVYKDKYGDLWFEGSGNAWNENPYSPAIDEDTWHVPKRPTNYGTSWNTIDTGSGDYYQPVPDPFFTQSYITDEPTTFSDVVIEPAPPISERPIGAFNVPIRDNGDEIVTPIDVKHVVSKTSTAPCIKLNFTYITLTIISIFYIAR